MANTSLPKIVSINNSRRGTGFKDLLGQRFSRLLVIAAAESKGRKARWLCQCDCGQQTVVDGYSLRSGKTVSCGCFGRERAAERCRQRTTHGRTKTSEYFIYSSMIQRTTNPNAHAYERYGGRGITVCDRWRQSFENFLADMGERPSKKYTLDRIDNEKGYEPSNCRWATYSEQNKNRRPLKKRKSTGNRSAENAKNTDVCRCKSGYESGGGEQEIDMQLDGKLTFLVNQDSTTISVMDRKSSLLICEITLTPEQLSMALSRLAMTPCQVEVSPPAVNNWGKRMEVLKLEFELPEHLRSSYRDTQALKEYADSVTPAGWVADGSFQRQDSFFTKDGNKFARCTMRRWVEGE